MPDSLDSYHFTLILVAVITSVVAPVLLQLMKYLLNRARYPEKKEPTIIEKLHQEGIIVDRLEKIRKKYNVDRVWVAIFHNGSHTFTGKSLQKFSLVYETTKKGVSNEGSNTQNLPTSLFVTLFREIADKGMFQILDTTVTGDAGSSSLQGFFESRGIKSFLALSMLDIQDNIVGIMCLDSIHDIIKLNNQELENLKREAGIMAGYIE
jgi:hypothetical protein